MSAEGGLGRAIAALLGTRAAASPVGAARIRAATRGRPGGMARGALGRPAGTRTISGVGLGRTADYAVGPVVQPTVTRLNRGQSKRPGRRAGLGRTQALRRRGCTNLPASEGHNSS